VVPSILQRSANQFLDAKVEAMEPNSDLPENGEDGLNYATCASSATGIAACLSSAGAMRQG